MSSTKNLMTTLFSQLDRSPVDGASLSRSLTATSLVSSLLPSSGSGMSSQSRPGADGDLKALSFSSKDVATGIQFGSPGSRVGVNTPSVWSTLLKQTATGSVKSAVGGSGGLSVLGTLGGVGGLISGLSSLFGGKSTPPPLVAFQLPQVQAETVYVGGNGSSSYQGLTGANSSSSTAGTYKTPTPASNQNLTYQSSQIAQAVKQAMLNSSSLNDVIAEI